jgi:hypothetical protein
MSRSISHLALYGTPTSEHLVLHLNSRGNGGTLAPEDARAVATWRSQGKCRVSGKDSRTRWEPATLAADPEEKDDWEETHYEQGAVSQWR